MDNQINRLDFVKSALTGVPASRLRFIAKKSKVPYMTLRKIIFGPTKNPGYNTVDSLYQAIEDEPDLERAA